MLDDLRVLRELQERQREALEQGDPERVSALCQEGDDLLAALPATPPPADRDRARLLAGEVIVAQGELEALAARVRQALAAELRGMAPGRDALVGYRPPMRDTARLVDRAH